MPSLRAKSELSKGQTTSSTSELSKPSKSGKSTTNSSSKSNSSEKLKNKFSSPEASSSKREKNSSSENHSSSRKSSVKLCVVNDGKSHLNNDSKQTITSPTLKSVQKRKVHTLSDDDDDMGVLEIKATKSTKKSHVEVVISEDDEIHLSGNELEFDDYDISPRKKLSTKKSVPMLTVSDSD